MFGTRLRILRSAASRVRCFFILVSAWFTAYQVSSNPLSAAVFSRHNCGAGCLSPGPAGRIYTSIYSCWRVLSPCT